MATTFRSADAWRRIRSLASRSRGTLVAVPFLGTGGARLLPLRAGDVLVVRFDGPTVASGQTNPREIATFLRRGVEVHACANLHAKVFVFGRVALIGSTNVSTLSEQRLLEALLETDSRPAVNAARRFIEALRGDPIGLQYARRMFAVYRPPRGPRGLPRAKPRRPIPRHSPTWAVRLEPIAYDEVDVQNQRRVRREGRQRMQDPRRFVLDDFRWEGSDFRASIQIGHRLVMLTDQADRRTMVSPPARVVGIRPYRTGRARRSIVCVEVPRHARRRNLRRVIKALGPVAQVLKSVRLCREVRNPALVYGLGSLWGKNGRASVT